MRMTVICRCPAQPNTERSGHGRLALPRVRAGMVVSVPHPGARGIAGVHPLSFAAATIPNAVKRAGMKLAASSSRAAARPK